MSDQRIKAMLDAGVLRVNLTTGQVFSPRSNTPERPLGALTRKGYLRTIVHFKGKPISVMLHRVTCIAAHGLPPAPNSQVNHLNGIKTDNRPANIEWSDQDENMGHAKASGLLRPVRHGAHYNARLTAEQISQIRQCRAAGERVADLAREFRVSEGHIRRVAAGLRWSEKTQDRPNG